MRAAQSDTPVSDRCRTCGGNGKCVTCDGTGSRRRVRRQLAAPVSQASPGLEICWSCRGQRFCGACDGSGVQDSGQPCNHCTMSGGFCPVCEGSGQAHPDAEDVPPIDRGYGLEGERAGLTPKWFRPLDVGEPQSISAASPGMIVVRGSTATVAYDARGVQQWRVPRELVAVRALPDGRTVVRTEADVRILDPLGEILTAWPAIGRQAPHPFPGDRWIDVEGTFQTQAELVCRALGSAEQWRVPLGCRAGGNAGITGSQVVVSDSTGFRLYDDEGRERRRGVIAKASPGSPPSAATSGIFALGDGYIAPFRGAHNGAGWYRWRPENGEIAPFGAGAAFVGPAAVSDGLFVTTSFETTDTGLQFIRAFSANNTLAWKLAFPCIGAIVGTGGGGTAVVSSLTVEQFEAYRALRPVEHDCRITLLDRGGATRRAVLVREPIAPIAAFAGGSVYVALYSGKLLAIDAS